MAHRLATSMCRIDRILKSGRLTRHFSIVAQFPLRKSESRQFPPQSNIYFSYEPPKFGRPVCPKESRSGSAAKIKGKKTAKQEMNKGPDNASSKSRSKFERKTPNQGSKSGRNGDGGGDRKNRSSGPGLGEEYVKYTHLLVYISTVVTSVTVNAWRHARTNIYERIAWKDFVDNYMLQGRVESIKVINEKWLQVQTAPGASADDARTVLVKIDSLDCCRNITSMAMKPLPFTTARVAQHKGQETAEKKNIHKATHTAPSTSLRMSAMKALSQGLNSCCNGDAGWDRKKNSRTTYFEDELKKAAFLLLSFTTLVLLAFRSFRKNTFNAFARKGLKDCLVSSKVAKVEVTEEKSLRVQPFPGTSMEYKETLRVKIENFKSAENKAPENENLETKVEHKNEAPVVHKNARQVKVIQQC